MMLLFPFGLTADQIVWWGFVATFIAAVCAVWSGVAATLAAKYGKDAPTKDDLKRVENHVGVTAEHLLSQRRHDTNMVRASRVSIAVTGRSFENEGLTIQITIRETTVKVTSIDLRTIAGTSHGSSACVQKGTTYTAHVSQDDVSRWFRAGITEGSATSARLWLRVHMEVEAGEEGYNDMPVRLSNVRVADTRTEAAYGSVISQAWEINGEV